MFNQKKKYIYSDKSRVMVSLSSTKFLHFSHCQRVTFSAFIHFGNLLPLHFLQNRDIVYHISTSISTRVLLKGFVLDSKMGSYF